MAECKFLICVHTMPELILIQRACLMRYLKQTFELCIVDDSNEPLCTDELKRLCAEFNYEYLRCPTHAPERQHPSGRHADALNFGWFTMKKGPYKYIGVLDNDMFLISSLDLSKELSASVTCLGLRQTREHIYYFWPGVFILSTEYHTPSQFNWDIISEGSIYTDPGGATYYTWSDTDMGVIPKEYEMIRSNESPSIAEWLANIKHVLSDELVKFCEDDCILSKTYGVRQWVDVVMTNTHAWFHLRGISNWQNQPTDFIRSRVERFILASTDTG